METYITVTRQMLQDAIDLGALIGESTENLTKIQNLSDDWNAKNIPHRILLSDKPDSVEMHLEPLAISSAIN